MPRYEDLRPIQKRVAERMCHEPALMLGLSMGIGKTVTTLTACRYLLDTFQVRHILIVAPLLVAEEVWPEEIENWEHTAVLEYEVLTGPPDRREQRAKRLPEISIVNTENLTWLVDFWGVDWPYDMLVIDEISRFKNPAKRTKPTKVALQKIIDATMSAMPKDARPEDIELMVSKALKKAPRNPTRFGALCGVRKLIDRVYGLTGTMAPNGLLDIYSQFYLLDQGQRLGSSYGAYRSRYFESDYNGFKYTLRPGAFELIVDKIKDITISLRTEDYVDMPEVIYNSIKVRLPEKVMKQYRKFKKTLLLEAHDIEAVNNGVLTNKLLQLCIAEGTEVLCRRGWVPIETVSDKDEVWDGVEFVSTNGVIYKGESAVVTCYGVDMTTGHRVLTEKGWFTAEEILYGNAAVGLNRAPVWLPNGSVSRGYGYEQSGDMEVRLHLREGSGPPQHVLEVQSSRGPEVVWMPARGDAAGGVGDTRYDGSASLDNLDADEESVSGPTEQGLPQLRRPWNRLPAVVVRVFQRLLGGCSRRILGRAVVGQAGQHARLQQGELSLGLGQSAGSQYAGECHHRHSLGTDDNRGSCGKGGVKVRHSLCAGYPAQVHRGQAVPPAVQETKVYDILDCGPRNRFVVRGKSGPLIVHNCNGSVYDEEGNAIEIHDLKLDALDSVIEEANGAPVLVAYSFEFDLIKLKKRYPKAEVVGETANLQKRWNNGEISILLAHPASAGHGLNLQYGGCITVWYGLNWSLELYQQLNKRLHRPGQKETVIVHHIIAEDTVDERVMAVLPEKDATQSALTQATLFQE